MAADRDVPRLSAAVTQAVAAGGLLTPPRVSVPERPSAASARPAAMPVSARALIGVVFGCWLLVVGYSVLHLSPRQALMLAPIFVLTALVRRAHVGLYAAETYISISVVGSLAAGMLTGVPGAVTCSSIAMLAGWTQRSNWRALLFNLGAVSLSNGAAALSFAAADRAIPDVGGATDLIPGALLAASVTFFSESAFVALIVALTQRRTFRRVWVENFRWLLPHWMGMGLVALGLARTYEATGFTGLLAFTGPALLMRYGMKQYLDRTARSAAELRTRNEELERANSEIADMSARLQEAYVGTLEALAAALDARDRETYGHSARVSQLTMVLARELSIEEGSPEWLDIERGSLLHDVGKIGVADAILRKPGKLTDTEWVDMRRHPSIGHGVLKDVPFLAGAAEIVAAHHEQWDGNGYPRQLVGEEIPLGARMFMLADTFDAMCTDRPYRRARGYDECLEEIRRCSGTQFDPGLVAVMERVYDQWVELHRASIAQAGAARLTVVA